MSEPIKGRRKIERAERFWRSAGIFLAILVLVQAAATTTYPWFITVHQPADRMVNNYGALGEVPKHKIYSFAKDITQMLLLWPNNAKMDFIDNMQRLQHYITDEAKSSIYLFVENPNPEYGFWENDRISSERLNGIQRKLVPYPSEVYSPASVRSLDGGDTWVVDLDFTVEDTMNNNPIFSDTVRFSVIVRRWPISIQRNEQGLAWAGFERRPQRIRHEVTQRGRTHAIN